MRIDKYLWCTRYFKTRNIASTAVKKGQVKVNGDSVKPSREVYPMDKIVVRKNQIDYQLTVLDLPESRVGQFAKKHYRKKGLGRPTKKDRRDLDDFLDESE